MRKDQHTSEILLYRVIKISAMNKCYSSAKRKNNPKGMQRSAGVPCVHRPREDRPRGKAVSSSFWGWGVEKGHLLSFSELHCHPPRVRMPLPRAQRTEH